MASAVVALPVAQAQTPCVSGDNPASCFIASDTTIAGNVTSSTSGVTVDNAGTVTNIILQGHNSVIKNSGFVGVDIGALGDHTHITNLRSGHVNQNIATNAEYTSITNFGSVRLHIFARDHHSPVTNFGFVGQDISTYHDYNPIINFGRVGRSITTGGVNFGDFSPITNYGSVGGGISTGHDFSPVTNFGSIEWGIGTQGDNSNVTNTGSVGHDIATSGDNMHVMNSGTVGQDIEMSGDNTSVTNSGSVTGFVQTLGDFSSVTNSGFIGNGITIDGQNPTLTLLPGSVVIGAIDLSGAGTRTLNIGPGLSAVQAFTTAPTVINAPGAATATNGNQVATVDTTAIGQTGQMVSTVTRGISGTVHSRLGGAPGAASTSTAATQFGDGYLMGLGAIVREPKRDHVPAERSSGAWALAFGGHNSEDATLTSAANTHAYAGGVAGVDGWLSPNLRVGLFGGGASGNLEVAGNGQQLESETVFGGGYANLTNGSSFLRLVLTAGWSDYDSRRVIANNLAAGGVQTATASYDGTFISPEIAIGTAYDLGWVGIEPSARLSYAHVSLDRYSETGAATNFSVSDQDISVWQGRVQIAMPFRADGAVFAPRIGVEAWTSDRGTVSGRLLGQAISFKPGGDDSDVTAFVGASASTSLSAGATAFLDGEVHAGDGGIARSEAHAGLRFNF